MPGLQSLSPVGITSSRGLSDIQTSLTPEQEQTFREWFYNLPWSSEFLKKYGERPDPNDTNYNYRLAYLHGIEPQRYAYDDNSYHWPSSTQSGEHLKSVNHPTAWMNDFLNSTGTDPNVLGLKTPFEAWSYYMNLRK